MAMLAINNRDAASTSISPFFMIHGYNVDLLNLIDSKESLKTIGKSLIAREKAFVARLQEVIEVAQAVMASA